MTPPEVEPIRKSVVVNTGVERAFALFTNGFDAIKPREHNLLTVPIAETVFEPRVGGLTAFGGRRPGRCARRRPCPSATDGWRSLPGHRCRY